MKKQAIYLFLAYALCSATSCKKDSSSSSSNSGLLGMVKSLSEKITSTVTGNRYTKVNFNYDSQGRLSSMIDSSNSGNKNCIITLLPMALRSTYMSIICFRYTTVTLSTVKKIY